MKLAKIKNRIKSVVMASALSLALLAGFPPVEAQAAYRKCLYLYHQPVLCTSGNWSSGRFRRGRLLRHRTRNGRRMRVSDWYFRGGR